MQLDCFDVLELHCWIHSAAFDERSGFNHIAKDRAPDRDYRDYQRRIDAAFTAMRPQFVAAMHEQLAFARDWARELAVPLTTSEAWGPWWHMDHPDLRWDWLQDWCAECMALSGDYGFWGSTPWNFSHPYWVTWRNIEWYRRLNQGFLAS